ncbi:MAG: NINE protein [Flavobacteriaceae bacterium]|nr:NINE protein [Flavobacteriaceae bacterium]
MSDEKKLQDDLNDMLGDAKEEVKKAAGRASEKASEFASEAREALGGAKEKAEEFAGEARVKAGEFADEAKEAFDKVTGRNKKVLAGLLAIFLGGLGIHKFVLGYNKEGIILLVCSILVGIFTLGIFTLGIFNWIIWIFTVVEGIIYLTKSDEVFYNTYQVDKKAWF